MTEKSPEDDVTEPAATGLRKSEQDTAEQPSAGRTPDSPADQPSAGPTPDAPTERSGDEPRRPRPTPSATSRARRAAAAGVEPALRRPRPTPEPDGSAAKAEPDARTKPALTKAGLARPAAEAEPAVDRAPSFVRSESATGDADSAEDGPTPHRIRSRAPLWLAALLAVVLVALGAGAWWLHSSPARSGSVSQRDQALAAAKTSVPLILSYGYQTFDADLAKAKAQLTGKAQSDYATAMTATIKPAATKSHVVVQASTDGAGVEAVSPDGGQVTVIVFGEQKVTNTSLTSPRIDMFRVRAVLERVGGHWLVSKFNQI